MKKLIILISLFCFAYSAKSQNSTDSCDCVIYLSYDGKIVDSVMKVGKKGDQTHFFSSYFSKGSVNLTENKEKISLKQRNVKTQQKMFFTEDKDIIDLAIDAMLEWPIRTYPHPQIHKRKIIQRH